MVLLKVSFLLLHLTVLTSSVVSSGLSYLGNHEEGQNCGINSDRNGSFGKCLKIKDCKSEFNEYKNNQRGLQVCSYSANKNSEEDLICCSKDDLEKSKLKLKTVKRTLKYQECVDRYLKYRENYQGNSTGSTGSIVKGSATYKGQFPNMVAIGWTQDDKSVEYNCGGSIITELFIATAAHCSSERPDVVRVGDIDLISDTDDEDVQQLNIARIIKHPEYSIRSNYHDIALLKVDREIKMNQFVAPACIQYGPTNNLFEAAGYGLTGFGEEKANKLMKVNLRSFEQKECKDYYHNSDEQKLRRGIVEEQLCAMVSVIDGIKKDICAGDGGGGLQYNNHITIGKTVYQIPTLVGIVSFGVGCGFEAPSVFTNVTSYVQWMESVIFAE